MIASKVPVRLQASSDPKSLLCAALSWAGAPSKDEPDQWIETHASWVLLGRDHVIKTKKPVDFGFLDYSTLDKRRSACIAEFELNRRLSFGVYLHVLEIARTADGELQVRAMEGARFQDEHVEADLTVLDYAVHMRRLPDNHRLSDWIAAQRDLLPCIPYLATRLADFHQCAERDDESQAWSTSDVVIQNARENFDTLQELAPALQTRYPESLAGRCKKSFDTLVDQVRPELQSRHEANLACHGHGDLRLEHVYVDPNAPNESKSLQIIDCVEFSAKFCVVDPAADLAFLGMELAQIGQRKIAKSLFLNYQDATRSNDRCDLGTASLQSFYLSYRSMVRAKVHAIRSLQTAQGKHDDDSEKSSAAISKNAALQHSTPFDLSLVQYFLLSLGWTENLRTRPRLVILTGLPGTGKSTLAREFTHLSPDVAWIRTDSIRQSLSVASESKAKRYSSERTAQTYDEAYRQSVEALTSGRGVIVDASFQRRCDRNRFAQLAHALAVPFWCVECYVPRQIALHRIIHRQGDPSEADPSVYDAMAARFEPAAPNELDSWVRIQCTDSLNQLVDDLFARFEAGEQITADKATSTPESST